MPKAGKRPSLPPPPEQSARLYLRLSRPQTRLFRYLLEARDNLAFISVVDRRAGILKIGCAPAQYPALLDSLEEIRSSVPFEFISLRLQHLTLEIVA